MNYGHGLCSGYVVVREYRHREAPMWGFAVRSATNPKAGLGWLNGYRLVGDRLVGRQMPENSAGYSSNGGGLDGDGRDEIRIERPAKQGWLF